MRAMNHILFRLQMADAGSVTGPVPAASSLDGP